MKFCFICSASPCSTRAKQSDLLEMGKKNRPPKIHQSARGREFASLDMGSWPSDLALAQIWRAHCICMWHVAINQTLSTLDICYSDFQDVRTACSCAEIEFQFHLIIWVIFRNLRMEVLIVQYPVLDLYFNTDKILPLFHFQSWCFKKELKREKGYNIETKVYMFGSCIAKNN
jgi:hypothetical protein